MTHSHRVRSNDLTWREVDDEVVVLDLASSSYFALNGTGGLLWKSLVEGNDQAELAALLVREFDIPPRQAAEDVASFLAHCASLGITE